MGIKAGSRQRKEALSGYLFILPNLLLIGIFFVYPLFQTFKLSFYEAGLHTSTFIGLQNLRQIFADAIFINSMKNTLVFVLIIVPVIIAISLILAGLMRTLRPASKSLFRMLFYLPVVCTPVVLTMVWAWMYNTNIGVLNYLTGLFGAAPVEWLGSPSMAVTAVAVVVITWSLGQPIILYLASMDGIPPELYEAADMDGAGPLRKFFGITLPLISNTTLFVSITSTIAVFQIFAVIHLLTSGGPYYSTETLVYTIYRTAFSSLEFGKASAQGLVLFFIIMMISLVQLRLIRPKS